MVLWAVVSALNVSTMLGVDLEALLGIARVSGSDRCIALPILHYFRGSKIMSCYRSRGKCTAWNTRRVHSGVKPAFCFVAATLSP